jgi:murein DD-endopeptidase MepM/ murein hydrolase activator NlpD
VSGAIGKLALKEGHAQRAEGLGTMLPADARERKRVAEEFASFLFLEVLKAMRAAMPQGGWVDNESLSRDIYSAMMDAELARVMAKRDVTGLTQMVEKSLQAPRTDPPQPAVSSLPVKGVVSSAYGTRLDPITGTPRFHQGIDIAAPAGTPVMAVAPGKITFSGRRPGYGNVVEIDHGDGTTTRYAHNSTNLVSPGQEVQAGQAIALVGSTGRASGHHLHFELRRGGKTINPESALDQLRRGVHFRAKV